MMDEWWIEPMRTAFADRSIVLAGAMGASWTEHIELLRAVGVRKLLVIATEGRGVGPLPDVPTLIVEPGAGLSQMERIHAADRALHEPTTEMVDAIEDFDPAGEALVIGTFLSTAPQLVGRPIGVMSPTGVGGVGGQGGRRRVLGPRRHRARSRHVSSRSPRPRAQRR